MDYFQHEFFFEFRESRKTASVVVMRCFRPFRRIGQKDTQSHHANQESSEKQILVWKIRRSRAIVRVLRTILSSQLSLLLLRELNRLIYSSLKNRFRLLCRGRRSNLKIIFTSLASEYIAVRKTHTRRQNEAIENGKDRGRIMPQSQTARKIFSIIHVYMIARAIVMISTRFGCFFSRIFNQFQ